MSYGKVARDRTEINESPMVWLEGVNLTASVQIKGSGTLASATMTLYENKSEVPSKLTGSLTIPTGSRVIKLKTMTSLVGGSIYKWYVTFTDDGISTSREGTIHVLKLGVNPSKFPSAINRFQAQDSPLLLYPNFNAGFNIIVRGRGKIEASSPAPVTYLYRGTQTAAALLSGSEAVSDRTITTKTISGMSQGEYILYLTFTDNGNTTWRYVELLVPKLGV